MLWGFFPPDSMKVNLKIIYFLGKGFQVLQTGLELTM